MPFLVFCALPFAVVVAFFLCRGYRGTFAYRVGQVLALAERRAGILFVAIAMVVLAVLGVVFGVILGLAPRGDRARRVGRAVHVGSIG